VNEYPLDHINPERLWYGHEVAIDQAELIAARTSIRQRVRKVSPNSNIYRCTWLIEEI
jgi:hypothetical protein